jgi:protease I
MRPFRRHRKGYDKRAEGKVVVAICHGGWMPISAGVYKNVWVTGSLGLKDDF